MSVGPVPVDLNQGLELESSALAKKPGALIDCLNYEYTTADGLRRIDGYEPYDGWVNGGAVDIWSGGGTVVDAGLWASAAVGDIVSVYVEDKWITVGVLISKGATSFVYAAINKDQAIIRSGDNVAFDGSNTATLTLTADAAPVFDGQTASDYMDDLRTYQSTLRGLYQPSNDSVCGLHVFRNNLIVARDAPLLTLSGVGSGVINVGDVVQVGGFTGLVIAKSHPDYWMEPYVNGEPDSLTVNVKNKDGTNSATAVATTVDVTRGPSEHAFLEYFRTPETSSVRGPGRMYRSVILTFDNGTQAAGADPKVGDAVNVGPTFGVNHYLGVIKSIVLTSGTWAAGTAAGRVEVVFADPLNPIGAGAINKVAVGDTVRIGSNSIFVIDAITRTTLPGTKKLRRANAHYVAETYAFDGRQSNIDSFWANGAGRAVWARVYNIRSSTFAENPPTSTEEVSIDKSYGNIIVNPDNASVDIPKWVSLHGRNSLALGFAGGEVAFSVVYEPHNFNGLDGAQVVGVADEITGLVEAVGDSTVVFGRRSISRIIGSVDSLTQQTISPRSGAFPYTCTVIGRMPVFTDHSGISTLEQADTYSDFAGARSSAAVDSALRPKLLGSLAGSDVGGVHCAFSVRGKSQYRLFLRSGTVYNMCITSQGPRFTVCDYSNDNTARLPFAWSCQIMDSGKEMIAVSWDRYYALYAPTAGGIPGDAASIDASVVYELDTGWGFSGETFDHYFVIGHMFMDAAANSIKLPKFRMFGKSYGFANLVASSASVERDFDQDFSSARIASMPSTAPEEWQPAMRDTTCFGHIANWGLGIKLKIAGGYAKGQTTVEPPHVCQLLVLYTDTTGVHDG